MTATLKQIVEQAFERLAETTLAYLPPFLAGLIILAGFWLVAVLVRWTLRRIFKGISIDRFLRQSGLASLVDRSGRMKATRLVSALSYWLILGAGALTALSAFNTQLTSTIIQSAVFLTPKLVSGGLMLLAGAWLAQYLGRSTLIWACNEEIPSPRLLAAAVRIFIFFISVVAASDYLDFARGVFLSAFVILVGGAVLAASLALGLGARHAVERRFFSPSPEQEEASQGRSIWHHL
jgi:hypothetical protein